MSTFHGRLLSLEEAMKTSGRFVAEGFSKGKCLKVDQRTGMAYFLIYKNGKDKLPGMESIYLDVSLFEKKYKKITNTYQLFKE